VAHAQSAGDDQYADPFGPVEPQDDSGAEQPPPVQGQTEGSGTAPDTTEQTTSTPEAAVAQSSGSGETLPRTGFEAWLLAAIGWWALLGGVALRRITTH